jgi:hypothetical protein
MLTVYIRLHHLNYAMLVPQLVHLGNGSSLLSLYLPAALRLRMLVGRFGFGWPCHVLPPFHSCGFYALRYVHIILKMTIIRLALKTR